MWWFSLLTFMIMMHSKNKFGSFDARRQREEILVNLQTKKPTKTHDNDGKVYNGRKRARLDNFCQPQWKQHQVIEGGAFYKVPPSWVFVGKEHMKDVFSAQLIFGDSVLGLDPVTMPASFRQQVSEESRHEWEERISRDRQKDSIFQGLWCSQTTGLLGRQRSEMKQKKRHSFVGILRKWKLSVFGNTSANTMKHTWWSSASSHSVLKPPCPSSSITTASTDLQICKRHSQLFWK